MQMTMDARNSAIKGNSKVRRTFRKTSSESNFIMNRRRNIQRVLGDNTGHLCTYHGSPMQLSRAHAMQDTMSDTRNHCANLSLRCRFLSESLHGTRHTCCAPLIHSSSLHSLHQGYQHNLTVTLFFIALLQALDVQAKFALDLGVGGINRCPKACAPP